MKKKIITSLVLVLSSVFLCMPIYAESDAQTIAKKFKTQGNEFYKQKKYKQALTAYTKAITQDMEYAEAYYNRGIVFSKLGSYYKSIVDFDMALLLNPEDSSAYYNRGISYYKVKNYFLALKDIEKADKLGDPDARALLARGILTKKHEEAVRNDKKIQEMVGTSISGHERKVDVIDQNNEYGGKTIVTTLFKGDIIYDGVDGIFKRIEMFDANEKRRRKELVHTARFNKDNGWNKTTFWYDESSIIQKKELYYTGKRLNTKGVQYYENGKVVKSVMHDKYGNEITGSDG